MSELDQFITCKRFDIDICVFLSAATGPLTGPDTPPFPNEPNENPRSS